MALYPKSFIQRLREVIAVSEVIGKRVPLKRKGREWEACCPFHQEKTPSFTVNDAKGFYHCFGCSKHGDALSFLMEFENLSYPEAIEALAQEAGEPLPVISPEMERREQKRASLQEVMAQAQQWFAQQLRSNEAQAARDYLQGRGLSGQVALEFGMGYALQDRQALRTYLRDEGATDQQLIATGLMIDIDGKEPYARFRGRVMFPILSGSGDVVGFGGRLLAKSDTAPKYLNSPETELFHKGQMLYNWKQARATVTNDKPLIVAEGYMDVIALHQAGITQGVAPLGTALTEHHLRLLWQACDTPVLCMDGDTAGQRAMWRSAELALGFMQPGKTLKFCTLPKGMDPDDFVKSEGSKAFQTLVANAKPLSQVIMQHARQETGEETPEQRAALEARLEELANQIANDSLKQHFRRYFREQLWARKGTGKRQKIQAKHSRVMQLTADNGRKSGVNLLERQLLRALVMHPKLLEQSEVEDSLASLAPQDKNALEIQQWLLEGEVAESSEDWPLAAQTLAQDDATPVPPCFTEKNAAPNLIQQAWIQLLEAYQIVQLESEVKALEQSLAMEMSENTLQQMASLKEQIADLRSRSYPD